MVQVSDEGAGVDVSVRDRLFEPFVTTKAGGTGLGLSIAHRAVEAHHGFIIVDGAEDGEVGTTFTVILPKLGAGGKGRTPRPIPESER